MSGGVESSSATKIILTSSDGETFEIEKVVALESQTIKYLIEDLVDETEITIPKVTGKILAKVIEYCKKHVDAASSDANPSDSEDELKKWDAEFVQVDKRTLFDVISAANYLNIKSLLDLTCETVADKIKDKTPHEIREFFNIVNNYTPEDEEKVRQEHRWAFQ